MKRLLSATLALLGVLLASGTVHAQETLRLGTCGTGGYWFQSGTVFANLINKYAQGVEAKALPTSCTAYNLIALGRNAIEIGLSLSSEDPLAYRGAAHFEAKGTKDKIRALSVWYTNYLHIFTLDPDIKSVADLRGKRMAIGVPKGGTNKQARAVLRAAGLDPEKDVELAEVNLEAGVSQLRAGQIDAQFWSMPTKNPKMSELTSTRQVYLIPITRELLEKLPDSLALTYGTIAAGTYAGQKQDVAAAAGAVTLVTRANLDNDTVKKAMGALFDHLDEFHGALPATAREVNKANALSNLTIPLHPGARAYYEEKGFPGLSELDRRLQRSGLAPGR